MFNPPTMVELLSTKPGTQERAELMRRYRGEDMTDQPSNRTATVTAATTALAHTGRGFTLQPGVYPVVDIDGAAERGVAYIEGPDDGALVCINPYDRNITISEGEK